jgi:hypothetical protein
MKKSSEEFAVGKHSIGYVSSDFKSKFGSTEFDERPMPTFQKLGRSMKDAAIESELKPGTCELGDVLAFMDNAPQECKDGYANLFYFPACVVCVRWGADYAAWYVDTWDRRGREWSAGCRVFSPATGRSSTCTHHCCSCALALELSELKEWRKRVEKVLNV